MHVHTAQISWQRGSAPFTDGKYARAHRWRFDGGVEVMASASPQRVPVPMSLEAAVDPEEALVAAVSSCHVLWFLYFAAKAGRCVDGYDDDAVGELAHDERGRAWLSTFILRPRMTWSGAADKGLNRCPRMETILSTLGPSEFGSIMPAHCGRTDKLPKKNKLLLPPSSATNGGLHMSRAFFVAAFERRIL